MSLYEKRMLRAIEDSTDPAELIRIQQNDPYGSVSLRAAARLRTLRAQPFNVGDRVHDNEGDTGTVIGFDEGWVLVDGDASGSDRPWRYLARELTADFAGNDVDTDEQSG